MTDLKPCPFCGSLNLKMPTAMLECVSCRDCGTIGPEFEEWPNTGPAMKAWNCRVRALNSKDPEEMAILQRLAHIESKFVVMEQTTKDVENLKEHVFKYERKPGD